MKNVIKISFVYFPIFLAAMLGLMQWLIMDLDKGPFYLMACAVPFTLAVAVLQVFPWVLIAWLFQRRSRLVRNRLVLLPMFIVNALFPQLVLSLIFNLAAPVARACTGFACGQVFDPYPLSEKAANAWLLSLFIALAIVTVAYRTRKLPKEEHPAA